MIQVTCILYEDHFNIHNWGQYCKYIHYYVYTHKRSLWKCMCSYAHTYKIPNLFQVPNQLQCEETYPSTRRYFCFVSCRSYCHISCWMEWMTVCYISTFFCISDFFIHVQFQPVRFVTRRFGHQVELYRNCATIFVHNFPCDVSCIKCITWNKIQH